MIDEALLTLEQVTKRFDGLVPLNKVTLTFGPATLSAIVGPNEAGKTTVFNVAQGIVTPDSGRILYRCQQIGGRAPHKVARLGIGRLFQDNRIFAQMGVLDNVTVARTSSTCESPLTGIVWPVIGSNWERQNQETAEQWLKFADLWKDRDSLAEKLSYGQQRKLTFARLLNSGAECLLLDEPTAGLAPEAAADLLGLIQQIVALGKTVVMIEHNLEAVERVADTVYVLNRGRVVRTGEARDVLGDPSVKELFT